MSELRGGSQAPLGTVRLDFLRQDCLARTGAALPPGQIPSSRGLHAPGLAPPLACLSPLGTQRPYLGSYLSEQEVGDAASAPSRQDLEAHRLELAPSVVHRQLLVHAPLAPVPGGVQARILSGSSPNAPIWRRRRHWHLLAWIPNRRIEVTDSAPTGG